MDFTDYSAVFVFIVNTGGGVVTYWALENIPGLKEWFAGLNPPSIKRWVAGAIGVGIAVAVWFMGVALDVYEVPGPTFKDWLTAVLNIIVLAAQGFATSTLAHNGKLDAARKRVNAALDSRCCGGNDCK